MQLGLIGLGKMGGNMRERAAPCRTRGRRLRPQPGSPMSPRSTRLVATLHAPARSGSWCRPVTSPAGSSGIRRPAQPGDLVIDGGNSRFTDDQVHAELLAPRASAISTVGSRRHLGRTNGYRLMVGGAAEDVATAMPIFDARCGPRAHARRGLRPRRHRRCRSLHEDGPQRHRVRPHAGVCRGYELLARQPIVTDVPGAFKAWTRGTVVRSWLLDLLNDALTKNPTLAGCLRLHRGLRRGADGPSRRRSLTTCRCRSSARPCSPGSPRGRAISPTMQAVSALRGEFGGHAVASVADGERLKAAKPTSAG